MLAKKYSNSKTFLRWNEQWGAPFGDLSIKARIARRIWDKLRLKELTGLSYLEAVEKTMGFAASARCRGIFGFQTNNSNRTFEYPWAFLATTLEPGMKALEIGGGLSGFQFALAKSGLLVTNVDPGIEAAGVGFECTEEAIEKLNDAFHTNVRLINTNMENANLEANSFDRIFSISVIEHLSEAEFTSLSDEVYRCLKPGGLFVATADLLLDLTPFTTRKRGRWGENFPVGKLLTDSRFSVEVGIPGEIYGATSFNADEIQSRLEEFVLGDPPAMVQCMVLKKRAIDSPQAKVI